MPHKAEIVTLCDQMQPCAQEFVRDLARKYAHRWPAAPPSSSPAPVLPTGRKVRLDQVDNIINGAFPVSVREVVDGQ
jgi:hypothetical protein